MTIGPVSVALLRAFLSESRVVASELRSIETHQWNGYVMTVVTKEIRGRPVSRSGNSVLSLKE